MSQLGVKDYLHKVVWKNPCASFVLPHVFFSKCYKAGDLNLCVLPLQDENVNIKVLNPLCLHDCNFVVV